MNGKTLEEASAEEAKYLSASRRCVECQHLAALHNGHCCTFCMVPGCPCAWCMCDVCQ